MYGSCIQLHLRYVDLFAKSALLGQTFMALLASGNSSDEVDLSSNNI